MSSYWTREQWRNLVFSPMRASLAQARVPKVAPWNLRELSLRRRAPVLSENLTHSGEEVSPKRGTWRPCSYFSSSRLSERSSPEWENLLAWARPSAWARFGQECAQDLFSSLFLGVCYMFWLDCDVKAWNEWICMYWMVYGLVLISLTWSWHVTCMGCLHPDTLKS